MRIARNIVITTRAALAHTTSAVALTAAALLIGHAFAQSANTAHEVPQAMLTMAQAVTIAETTGNGRATHARFDGAAAQPFYKVRVIAPSEAPLNLRIAAAGGRILSSERLYDH
jgi:hypothetical protein